METWVVAQGISIVTVLVALGDLKKALTGLLPAAVSDQERVAGIGDETSNALTESKGIINGSNQHKTTIGRELRTLKRHIDGTPWVEIETQLV